ncbi:MAG: RNA polymerase sigma factor [Candidatus Marinimicrobia bacterium]|nr:RNA polymerase sigma factor [Candidatus Neomarinimicrobiota bacterium]
MSNFESMLFSDSLKMKMINLAMSKTFNKFDAEDLVQQTYLKALERQDQFKGDNIDPWVITILKNHFIDSTRKKKEDLLGDDTPDLSTGDESSSVLLERDKDKCLKGLSEKEREIIALKQTNSYDEIAEDLDIKTGALRQMFSRAKEKFMRCMGFFDE